ncbi:MAG: hypothetical protein ABJA87_08975 [bacterium]
MAYLEGQFDSSDPERWHHLRDVTAALGPATNVEFESVRRAMPRLSEDGLIELRTVDMPQWGAGRSQTYARLRVSVSVGS